MGDCCSKFFHRLRGQSTFNVVDGRKYENVDSAYPLLHHETEEQRLTWQQRIMFGLLGANYFAPVTEILEAGGARVLDAGCGPGAWTLDLAATFPRSSFYGIDVTTSFLEHKLENVHFAECNILDGLSYPDASFDFVYSRFLSLSFSVEQWNFYIKELLRVTKPEGFIELHEGVFVVCGGSCWKRMSSSLISYMKSKGMSPSTPDDLPKILESTGEVTDVHYHSRDTKMGPNSDEWEEHYAEDITVAFDAMAPLLATSLDVTTEHFRAIVEGFRAERKQHEGIIKHVVIYARKKPFVKVET